MESKIYPSIAFFLPLLGFLIDLSGLFWYPWLVNVNFQQIPESILDDVEKGNLIPNDIQIYLILLRLAGPNNDTFQLSLKRIAQSIISNNKASKTGKIKLSLKRLETSNHIERVYKGDAVPFTTIQTKVLGRGRHKIKGKIFEISK